MQHICALWSDREVAHGGQWLTQNDVRNVHSRWWSYSECRLKKINYIKLRYVHTKRQNTYVEHLSGSLPSRTESRKPFANGLLSIFSFVICAQRYTTNQTNIVEHKTASLTIWNDLPQEFIDKAIVSFHNRLRSCVAAAGGHSEHSVYKYWAAA